MKGHKRVKKRKKYLFAKKKSKTFRAKEIGPGFPWKGDLLDSGGG